MQIEHWVIMLLVLVALVFWRNREGNHEECE